MDLGSSQAFLAIAGMAVGTYLTRVSGFYLVNHIRMSRRMEAFIKAIPGTVLMSIVAPIVFSSSPAQGAASLATVIAAWRFKNLPLSMAIGIAVVCLFRKLGI
jgi:uncharacterized membrane protein